MANEFLNPTTARDLLKVLELENEAKEEEISWALSILHKIPGYEKISLAKAAQDRVLKEVLIGIADETYPSPTRPEDIKTLLEKAKERERTAKEAVEKGKKETKEFIEAAKRVAEKAEPPVGIQINYGPSNPVDHIRSFGVRSALIGAAHKIAKEAPHEALALYLVANGVTHQALEKEAKTNLSGKEQKAILKVVEGIKKQEIGLATDIDFELIRRSMPAKSVTFLLGSESGLTQAQVFAFFNPEGQMTSFVPHQSFFGKLISDAGGQLFGKLSEKIATKVLGKAAVRVGGKAVAAAVGIATGPPGWVATLIAVVGPEMVSFVKRNFNKVLVGIGSVIFGAGLLLASTPMMLGGIGTVGAGFIGAAGGVGPALSTAGGFTAGAIGAIGSMVVSSLVGPLVGILIGVPIVVTLIIFIINSGAYIVPPGPTLEVPSFGGGGAPITCTKEKGAVSFTNTSNNPIAKRAWEITADLYQGFWCYWNRSPGDYPDDVIIYPPSYPETFNEEVFATNPNPTRTEMSTCGDCMFWCTWLVQKAYRESGNTSLLLTLWSPTMKKDFENRGKFIANRNTTPNNVTVGSVIFFKITPGPDRTNHVAIIYSVNEDGIAYVQSNAPTKDEFVPFNSSGKGIQAPSGMEVQGIGLP